MAGNPSGVPVIGFILNALSSAVWPIWALTVAGWVAQVVALAFVEPGNSNGHFLQFDWFVTAFEFLVLLFIPFHILARRSSPGILALTSVVSGEEILRANVWNNARLYGSSTQIDSTVNPGLVTSPARIQALFSAFLVVACLNLLLIIALGNLPAPSAQDEQQRKAQKSGEEHNGFMSQAGNSAA